MVLLEADARHNGQVAALLSKFDNVKNRDIASMQQQHPMQLSQL